MHKTKQVLIDSLNKVLLQKQIDKVTVKDIVSECDLTRQTFYNYFSDIYELVEYSACSNAKRILQRSSDYEHWQDAFYDIMIKLRDNQIIVENVYKSIYRDLMGKYIYKVIYNHIIQIVENLAENLVVKQKYKDFIAHFYTLSFIAVIYEWIRNDMNADPREIVDQIGVLVQGDFQKALQRYAQ
ncbi:TetR/AcrR family transcriptional regulator [Companilactobacillus halodurans]|uniref:TetR family transcriptional regulator n=1 Tax=Companilactobacillus halodurans TaxID=2584183 RepID=A0A5P0ZMH6_9LACO|nr:TetR/AcrR family transcriptional regulator [Companilactobacillus halodurans]MQS75386.1 TetR family transcriptional regulator [Companilactobacillus halodurans]MQS97331.1 TetR family transcriptional regulator [Companilactobacillus halodurans]